MNEVPIEEKRENVATARKFVELVSVARAGDIEALLDTGACISMVRRASLPEALLARMEVWKRAPLCGAGNKAIFPLGTVALTIQREGKAIARTQRIAWSWKRKNSLLGAYLTFTNLYA